MRRVRPYEPGTYWCWIQIEPDTHEYEPKWDVLRAHLLPLPVDPMGEQSTLCHRYWYRFKVHLTGHLSGSPRYSPPHERWLCPDCQRLWVQYVYDGTVTSENLPGGGDM